MTALQWATLGLLALAVLVGIGREWRRPGSRRWPGVIAQPLIAVLLWLLLYPPLIEKEQVEAIVLSPGVSAQQLEHLDPRVPTYALPDVLGASAWIEPVPDLATALRRNPAIGDLRVLGDGLPERDLEAIGQRGLAFEPGTDVRGLLDVQSPTTVRSGTLWTIQGIAAGVAGGHLRLLDRAGAVAAEAEVDTTGRFRLGAAVKTPAEAVYRLQLRNAGDAVVDELALGIVIHAGDSLNTVLLAGGADPETKYLRRWIMDSGSTLASRISLSRGIEQRQNDADLNAQALQAADLLVMDERVWVALPAAQKALIRSAVEQGTGLLLRVTGSLSAQTRAEWAVLGFAIENADLPRSARLHDAGREIEVTRLPLRVTADDSVALLTANDGSILASWRAIGQGRVAVWLPLDTWRLATDGDKAYYGTLWSNAFSTLARARGTPDASLPGWIRVDHRAAICGIGADAFIENAHGQRQRLLIDGAARNCAAWWPGEPGWQHLIDGEHRQPIFVQAASEAGNLVRAEIRDATRQRIRPASSTSTWQAPMPRWPLFLAWLLASGGFWWWQHRRHASRLLAARQTPDPP